MLRVAGKSLVGATHSSHIAVITPAAKCANGRKRMPALTTAFRRPVTTPAVMDRVLIALAPAALVSVWAFGPMVLAHCAVALSAGAAFDSACQWLRKREPMPFVDRSVPVTCLLIALALPPTAPLWIGALAVGIAIVLAKELYGGLGRNVFNPAMAGYAAVLVAYPQALTYVDAISGATALDALTFRGAKTIEEVSTGAAFGVVGSARFELVNAAALLGGLYLLVVRVIHWRIPAAVLLGLALPAVVFYDGGSSASLGSPSFHWFAGATMLGAFFIATDPVTAPRAALDQWLFGLGIGAVVFAIRSVGSHPDGVAFAVLLGNLATPLLDHRRANRPA